MIYQPGCQPAGGLGGQTSKNSGFPLPFLPDKNLIPNSPNLSKTACPTPPQNLIHLIQSATTAGKVNKVWFQGGESATKFPRLLKRTSKRITLRQQVQRTQIPAWRQTGL